MPTPQLIYILILWGGLLACPSQQYYLLFIPAHRVTRASGKRKAQCL